MTTRTAAANERPGATFLRIAIALQTLTIFLQAISAGLLPDTSFGAQLHDAGARVTYGTTMLYLLVAVLVWRRHDGSPRPVLYASGFLALATVQVLVGIAHIPSVHLPLGVLMFGLSLLVLAGNDGTRPGDHRPAGAAARPVAQRLTGRPGSGEE